MGIAYDNAVRSLVGLTADELRSIQQQVTALLSRASSATSTPKHITESGATIVFEQLLRFLQSKGLYENYISPKMVEMTKNTWRGFVPKCETLWTFISNQTPHKVEREALLQVGLACHFDHLSTWMDSVDIKGMLQFIDQVPMTLDSQFPGYARNGMLAFVVRGGLGLHTRRR